MWWIFSVLLALSFALAGYRRAKRTGLWSWSKFALSLGFALFETFVLMTPPMFLNRSSRYFWPAYIAAWLFSAVFFVLFILMARKWKVPVAATSLQSKEEITHGR